jgi:hypothetical protein
MGLDAGSIARVPKNRYGISAGDVRRTDDGGQVARVAWREHDNLNDMRALCGEHPLESFRNQRGTGQSIFARISVGVFQ